MQGVTGLLSYRWQQGEALGIGLLRGYCVLVQERSPGVCGLRWRQCDAGVSGSADGNTAVGRELERLWLRGWTAENREAIKAPRGHSGLQAFVGPKEG